MYMATKDSLPVKYSNEIYATQDDVKKDLHTTLIDNIWKEILEYRTNFSFTLRLKHFDKSPYFICLTPMINNKINSIERKLLKLVNECTKLEKNLAENELKKISFKKILTTLSKKYSLDTDLNTINLIVNGNASTLPANALILNRYYECLKSIENNLLAEINDTTLADFYSFIIGQEELTEFYREREIDSMISRSVINKLYIGIPVDAIEPSMDNLFEFINYSDQSLFIKAVATFFYSYYVMPFEYYNEDMSILLTKKVLAHNDLGKVASYLNLESILFDKEKLEEVILLSEKTFDLTYIVDYFANKIEPLVDEVLDDIVSAKQSIIKNEFYEKEVDTIEEKEKINVNSDSESLKEDNSKIEPKIVEKVQEESIINFNQNIAISSLPTGLSEVEAKRLEIHIRELDPNLSRSQAYFYARHCTLGMKYTIQDYKNATGCAYETARSSMDNLVYSGYYRKEMLKNKFIYTPVKKD